MGNERKLIGKKVLIVDDEIIITDVLRRYFSGIEDLKELKIFFANNTEDCLELLEREKPTLMILDLSLKGPAAETGLKIFNMYKGKLKIAVCSADDDNMIECLNKGAIEYLHKPPKREEFFRLIKTHA